MINIQLYIYPIISFPVTSYHITSYHIISGPCNTCPCWLFSEKSHLSGLEWQQLCVATNVCPGGDGHRLGSNHWMLTKTHGRDGHARLIICWSVGHILYTMYLIILYIYVYTYMYVCNMCSQLFTFSPWLWHWKPSSNLPASFINPSWEFHWGNGWYVTVSAW